MFPSSSWFFSYLSLPGLTRQSIFFFGKMDPRSSPRVTALVIPPNFLCELHDHTQLRPLFLLGKDIAFLGGGKAALGREAQLLEPHVFRRLIDAPLDVILAF
jgi:hypothetical protein